MYCPPVRTSRSSASSASHTRNHNTPLSRTPRSTTPTPGPLSPTLTNHTINHVHSHSGGVQAPRVKRVTLTSKKNWWMVEMDNEDDRQEPGWTRSGGARDGTAASFSSSEETAVHSHETPMISQPFGDEDPGSRTPTP